MPKQIRVGRSTFFLFSVKGYLVDKIGGKLRFAQNKWLQIVKIVFSGDLCLKKQKEKNHLGSGPFPRDGRVTGNKHLVFVRPLTKYIYDI